MDFIKNQKKMSSLRRYVHHQRKWINLRFLQGNWNNFHPTFVHKKCSKISSKKKPKNHVCKKLYSKIYCCKSICVINSGKYLISINEKEWIKPRLLFSHLKVFYTDSLQTQSWFSCGKLLFGLRLKISGNIFYKHFLNKSMVLHTRPNFGLRCFYVIIQSKLSSEFERLLKFWPDQRFPFDLAAKIDHVIRPIEYCVHWLCWNRDKTTIINTNAVPCTSCRIESGEGSLLQTQ